MCTGCCTRTLELHFPSLKALNVLQESSGTEPEALPLLTTRLRCLVPESSPEPIQELWGECAGTGSKNGRVGSPSQLEPWGHQQGLPSNELASQISEASVMNVRNKTILKRGEGILGVLFFKTKHQTKEH